MKYYAVTEDPRELFHYGVKGMKWGQHLFGDDLRPKSPAFKRAASKLRSFREKSKANKIAKEQNNYMKSVQKSQNKLNLLENLNKYDQEKAYYKQLTREQKSLNKQNKYANKIASLEPKRSAVVSKQSYKQAKRSTKAEKHMEKILQEAREGRLRYGKLSEEQIGRIQDRLNMENQARRLGGTEKPSWRQQKKEARRAGKLQGITRGTAAAMEEIARAGATFGVQHALARWQKRSAAKQEGKEQKAKDRARNKKTHHDIKQDIKQNLYEEQIKSGEGLLKRTFTGKTAAQRANALKELRNQNKFEEAATQAKLEARKEKDKEYYKYLEDNNMEDESINRKGIDKYLHPFSKLDPNSKEARENRNLVADVQKALEDGKKADAYKRFKEAQEIDAKNEAEKKGFDNEKAAYDASMETYKKAKEFADELKKIKKKTKQELDNAEARERLYAGSIVPDIVKRNTSTARAAYNEAKQKYDDAQKKIPSPPTKAPDPPNIKTAPEITYKEYQLLREIGLLGSGNNGKKGGGKGKK